jgi:hypothetical protein
MQVHGFPVEVFDLVCLWTMVYAFPFDYTGSCKSNYHTITATTAPKNVEMQIQQINNKCIFASQGSNKADLHDITEIWLQVALNTITLTSS